VGGGAFRAALVDAAGVCDAASSAAGSVSGDVVAGILSVMGFAAAASPVDGCSSSGGGVFGITHAALEDAAGAVATAAVIIVTITVVTITIVASGASGGARGSGFAMGGGAGIVPRWPGGGAGIVLRIVPRCTVQRSEATAVAVGVVGDRRKCEVARRRFNRFNAVVWSAL